MPSLIRNSLFREYKFFIVKFFLVLETPWGFFGFGNWIFFFYFSKRVFWVKYLCWCDQRDECFGFVSCCLFSLSLSVYFCFVSFQLELPSISVNFTASFGTLLAYRDFWIMSNFTYAEFAARIFDINLSGLFFPFQF